MKRLFSISFIAIGLIALVACSSGESNQENQASTNQETDGIKVVKFASTVGEDHPYSVAYKKFAELVEERTDGSIQFEYFFDGQLGGDREYIEGMKSNSIQATMIGSSSLAAFIKEIQVLDLPYLFPTKEIAFEVLDGEVGKEILSGLPGSGMVGLEYWDHGYFYLTNDVRPVTTNEDMNGLKIRTHGTQIQMDSYEALGMLPTVVSFAELYPGLQQGLINTQGNTIPNIISSNVYEVQDHITNTQLFYFPIIILFGEEFMESLTDEEEEIVRTAATEIRDWHKENNEKEDEKGIELLKEEGLTFSELEPGEFEKAKELTTPIYEDFAKNIDADILDKIQKEIVELSK